jgi:hypothetical protein
MELLCVCAGVLMPRLLPQEGRMTSYQRTAWLSGRWVMLLQLDAAIAWRPFRVAGKLCKYHQAVCWVPQLSLAGLCDSV